MSTFVVLFTLIFRLNVVRILVARLLFKAGHFFSVAASSYPCCLSRYRRRLSSALVANTLLALDKI